jgi:nucleoside-diphosphate-sugar epimerase
MRKAIVVTGSTGYVGGHLTRALLADGENLILPIRVRHAPDQVRRSLLDEMAAAGFAESDIAPRIQIVPVEGNFNQHLGAAVLAALGDAEVADVVHSAGCLSYFNVARLQEGNQNLTRSVLGLARDLGGARVTYISTAFCSGYVEDRIEERLHATPLSDPNEYTKSKRTTEWIVADSGLPFLIMRPSAVVGNSTTGLYDGPPYGAYQFWTGMCRFLCDVRRPVIHAVAPTLPLNFVHQDAMAAGFLAAFRRVPNGTVLHLASRDATLPTTRDMWQLWMERCGQPGELRYYDHLPDVPRDQLDTAQQLLLDFTEGNIEISSRRWNFATDVLDGLRSEGLSFADVTRDSFDVCLGEFLRHNAKAVAFMRQHPERAQIPTVHIAAGEVGRAAGETGCGAMNDRTAPVALTGT